MLPHLYKWNGGILRNKWPYGYLVSDFDLICIVPNITGKMKTEIMLSPVCCNRLYAISAFSLKRILLRIDGNMGARRLPYDSPNKEYGNR